ncbi:MAG: peptidoglycan editing factor PgeF [Halioglobus sp.]
MNNISGEKPELIFPDWPAPDCITAAVTTRVGGCSAPPYASFNLGHHVEDSADAVSANRNILLRHLGGITSLHWLEQVHGTVAVEAGVAAKGAAADAQWSRTPGVGCAVLTADCLPVLFCSSQGEAVAAAHAGWRGLEAGVLENTVKQMNTATESILAWMGPAIGPAAFEVGCDVYDRFVESASQPVKEATAACFTPRAGMPEKYLADLYALATLRLQSVGVAQIFGGGECTYSTASRFFSYRRDTVTGRMASVIGIRAD